MKANSMTIWLKLTAFTAVMMMCCGHSYAQANYKTADAASVGLMRIAIQGTIQRLPEFPSGWQLCPSWKPVKSSRGWRCNGTFFGKNKARLIKANSCKKPDPKGTPFHRKKCHKENLCVHKGKVKVPVNLSMEKSGKKWVEKAAMQYTCSGMELKGKVTKKIFDKPRDRLNSHKVLSKDYWTMSANYKRGIPIGLSTIRFKKKDVVQATCRTETDIGGDGNHWGFRSYRLWQSGVAIGDGRPPSKNSFYMKNLSRSEFRAEKKAATKEYRKAIKVLKKLVGKCKKFKPADCKLVEKPGANELSFEALGSIKVKRRRKTIRCVTDLCAIYGKKNPGLCSK